MGNRGLLFALISLFTIKFVSAYNGYGFNLSNIFYTIDPDTMLLITIFLISFAVLYFSLSRVFRGNAAIAAIVALTISLFITYSANQSGLDFNGVFYDLGIDSEVIFPILVITAIIISGIIWWMSGFGIMLIILGVLFLAMSFFAYEKGVASVIGGVLIVVGIIFAIIKKARRKKPYEIRLRR